MTPRHLISDPQCLSDISSSLERAGITCWIWSSPSISFVVLLILCAVAADDGGHGCDAQRLWHGGQQPQGPRQAVPAPDLRHHQVAAEQQGAA